MNDWDEDFGERYSAPLWREPQNLDNCVGMKEGKPVWSKVVQNPDGSFSPFIEKTFESQLTAGDRALLKGMKIGIKS